MSPNQRRNPEIVVLSDVHLGTYGCHADELVKYLDSVQPKTLVLNGDIIDFWYLHWRYWPKSHMRVLETLVAKASQGVRVYYLTGNHDDVLRRFSDLSLGNFTLTDKLVLDIDEKPYWIFHGDVLDSMILEARWLAQLGGWGYDRLILFNRLLNKGLQLIGKPRVSLSKMVKAKAKEASMHFARFEQTLADLAVEKKYYGVICGHIHAPGIKMLKSEKFDREVLYLNSGDWVEHLTALEYEKGQWKIVELDSDKIATLEKDKNVRVEKLGSELNSSL